MSNNPYRWLAGCFALLLIAAASIYALAQRPAAATAPVTTPGEIRLDAGSDADGNFTVTIPIDVPPGIGQAQPSLSLRYSSGGVNGLLGVGWQLTGFSAITRCPAIPAVDQRRGTVSFNSDDRYCLDGQRLINVSGDYGQPGTVYRTERESWQLVVSSSTMCGNAPCQFTRTSKTGQVTVFGGTPDSRALAGSGPNVRSWLMSSTSDTNSNLVTFTYAPNQGGSPNIQTIAYGQNTAVAGTAANRFVRFVYQDGTRSDPITNYVGGISYRQTALLTHVQTYVDAALVRDLTMSYTPSVATGRSLLTQLQRCSPSQCLTPTTIAWQGQQPPTFTPQALNFSAALPGTITPVVMDANGDGIGDLVGMTQDNVNQYVAPAISNGSTFSVCPNPLQIPIQPSGFALAADLNADGASDFVYTFQQGGLFGFALFFGSQSGCDFTTGPSGTFNLPANPDYQWAADINGDGKTDLVAAWKTPTGLDVEVMLSQGGTLAPPVSTTLAFDPTSANIFPADVNGDGMVDLVQITSGPNNTALVLAAQSNGAAFGTPIQTQLGTSSLNSMLGMWPVDINHDGLTDMVLAQTGANNVVTLLPLFANGAGGFEAGTQTITNSPAANTIFLGPLDTTGSGTPSMVQIYSDGGNISASVFLPTAGIFSAGQTFSTNFSASAASSILPADYIGNGRADLLQVWSNNGAAAVSGLKNANTGADLIQSVTNGLGNVTTVAYGPLSDPTLYTPGTSGSDALTYAYRMTPSTGPFQRVGGGVRQVVRNITRSNDPQLNASAYQYTESFRYAGGLVDLSGRGWLGFQAVERTQADLGRIRVISYNQAFPLTGTAASVSLYCTHGTSPDPKCSGDRMLLNQTVNSFAAVTVAAGAGPLQTPIQDTRLQQVAVSAFNYGQPDFTRRRAYQYDSYGNIAHIADFGVTGAENPVYTCSAYLNQTSATGWALGYLQHRKTSRSTDCNNFTTFTAGQDFHLEHYTYDGAFNQVSYAIYDDGNAAELVTTYSYDGFGNRLREVLPGNRSRQLSFDPTYNTYLLTVTVPTQSGGTAVTTYGYDPRFGQQVARTNSNGATFIACIDDIGRVTATQGPVPTAPAGVSAGVNCVGPNTGPAAFQQAAVVTTATARPMRDASNRFYVEVQQAESWPVGQTPGEVRWRRSYQDGLGRQYMLTAQSDENPSGVMVCANFDADSRTSRTSLPAFLQEQTCGSSSGSGLLWATQTFDAYSRPVTSSTPLTADGSSTTSTTYAYASGLVSTVTKGTDSDLLQTTVQSGYFNGRRKIVSMALAGAGPTVYGYDPTGKLTSIVEPPTANNPSGIKTTIGYDSVGRQIRVDNPDQNTTGNPAISAEIRSYGLDGLLASRTDAKGQRTSFTRDARGRVLQQTDPDGTITYGYDNPTASGVERLTSVSATNAGNPSYSRAFAYDSYGNRNLETITVTAARSSYTASKVFDPKARVQQEHYPDGSLIVRRYSGGNLRGIDLNGRPQVTFKAYTALGQPTTTQYANNAAATVAYLPSGLPARETLVDATGAKQVDNLLQWDGLLNLRGVADQIKPGGHDYSETFTYDSGRLVGATTNQLYADQAYQYSADGNRTQVNDLQLTYQAHRVVGATNASQPVLAVSYDPNGNVSSRTTGSVTTSFTYDAQNRLTLVQSTGAAQLQNLAFTNTGRRLAKRTPDGTTVVYPFANFEVTQVPGVAPLTTVYLTGGSRRYAAISQGGTGAKRPTGTPVPGTRFVHANQVRSTTVTLDDQGRLSSRFAYMPFGAPVPAASSGPDDVRPKFQGNEFEQTAQIYYFGARHYEPGLGHFLTADTQPATNVFRPDALNRYAFAINNPATLIDEAGHNIFDSILGAVIGVAEVAAGAAIDVLSDGALEPLGQGLIGAGINSVQYSATAGNHFSWKQFGDQNATGFVIGAVTGGFGEEAAAGEEAASDAVETSAQRAATATSNDIETDAAGTAVRTGVERDSIDVGTQASEKADEAGTDLGSDAEDECTAASFTADTPVASADGPVRIDSLHIGQSVLSRNAIDGIDRPRPVTRAMSRTVRDLIALQIAGRSSERLLVTPAHPVATAGGRWIAAEHLVPGTELVTHTGDSARVVAVTRLKPPVPITVHNLYLAPDHSYFAGANEIWVHNPCTVKDKSGKTKKGAKYDVILEMPESEYPESAAHIRDAQKAGHDEVLTIERSGAKANRRASLRGVKTAAGLDRDEYPPAMFAEGGDGADIRLIDQADNRGSGSSFGGQLRSFLDGVRVWFKIVK
ncbi:FG-GAP-like repeat-containing protein [Bradyrhizobium prioriisuperbiae]|uniref:FG-GAP-like repeat-containing protein n=1 Tax=Bradyrhizobium prioriisuperbiae TaxID=2854389 RepID=UPI0028EA9294|nr:FG-GAP-like repeat-containing protein [Bradyrhizobium prioritasuperba]